MCYFFRIEVSEWHDFLMLNLYFRHLQRGNLLERESIHVYKHIGKSQHKGKIRHIASGELHKEQFKGILKTKGGSNKALLI